VLELGSVPLPVVTARIDRFIAEGDKGPYRDMERAGLRIDRLLSGLLECMYDLPIPE
jgi:hypothetical protein